MKYFQQVLIMVAVMTQAGWVWADSFVEFRGREPEIEPLLRLSGIAA
jgi:Zn-dependent oligopeptidase